MVRPHPRVVSDSVVAGAYVMTGVDVLDAVMPRPRTLTSLVCFIDVSDTAAVRAEARQAEQTATAPRHQVSTV